MIELTLLTISGVNFESNLELDEGMSGKLGDTWFVGLFDLFPNGVDFLADFKLSKVDDEDGMLFVTSLNANNSPFRGVCKSIATFFDGWTK